MSPSLDNEELTCLFARHRAIIEEAGGYVHPSARYVPSEYGGIRLDIDCDKDTLSILAPRKCGIDILSVDFDQPRSELIASIIELWRHCYKIDNIRQFLADRAIDSGLVFPILSWADHAKDARKIISGPGAFAMAGSFMRYSNSFRSGNGSS